MTLTPRLLIGPYGDGTIGIKAALPGYDVTVLADDNDADKRSFNSNWPDILKLAIVGYYAGVGNARIALVTHGLGFIPYYEVQKYTHSGAVVYDDAWHTYTGGAQGIWVSSDADTSTIYGSVVQTAWTTDVAYLIWNRQIGT